jgi:hypothetical protein
MTDSQLNPLTELKKYLTNEETKQIININNQLIKLHKDSIKKFKQLSNNRDESEKLESQKQEILRIATEKLRENKNENSTD